MQYLLISHCLHIQCFPALSKCFYYFIYINRMPSLCAVLYVLVLPSVLLSQSQTKLLCITIMAGNLPNVLLMDELRESGFYND